VKDSYDAGWSDESNVSIMAVVARTLAFPAAAAAAHAKFVVIWALCIAGCFCFLDCTLAFRGLIHRRPHRHATRRYLAVVDASRFQARAQTSIPLLGSDTASGDDGDLLGDDASSEQQNNDLPEVVDVAIVGAGLGGLCAGAILNTVYGKTVAIFESHYLAGGCATRSSARVRSIT
jgi:NAD(P)-binding Rossmann-like domain